MPWQRAGRARRPGRPGPCMSAGPEARPASAPVAPMPDLPTYPEVEDHDAVVRLQHVVPTTKYHPAEWTPLSGSLSGGYTPLDCYRIPCVIHPSSIQHRRGGSRPRAPPTPKEADICGLLTRPSFVRLRDPPRAAPSARGRPPPRGPTSVHPATAVGGRACALPGKRPLADYSRALPPRPRRPLTATGGRLTPTPGERQSADYSRALPSGHARRRSSRRPLPPSVPGYTPRRQLLPPSVQGCTPRRQLGEGQRPPPGSGSSRTTRRALPSWPRRT